MITAPAQSISFTATPYVVCGSATIEYQVTYSPTSTTASLISLPSSTSTSILFAHSANTADANEYIMTVRARPAGTSTWLSPTNATYTYNDPCLTTSITTTPASIENLVAFVGYTVSSKIKYTFNDTVSISNTLSTDSVDSCGDKQLAF